MEIHIGNRTAEIELVEKDGNNVRLTIDGVEYEVDVTMAENGACSILHEGKSYNAELIRSENGKNYKVNTLFSSYNVDIVDTKAKYLRMPCIVNAANEIAVAAFLRNRISFLGMSNAIERVMQTVSFIKAPTYDDYVATDAEAREVAKELMNFKI